MAYIEIDIGGQKRGLKFNQMTDVEFKVKLGKSTNDAAYTYAMVWAALISNCFVKGIEVDFSFEDVCDWCEKISDDDFYKILEAYKSTKEFLKDIPDDIKKKVVKRSAQKNIKTKVLK